MKALGEIVRGIFTALFDWGQKQAEKPKETRDAKTPEETRVAINDDLTGRLRDKERDSGKHN